MKKFELKNSNEINAKKTSDCSRISIPSWGKVKNVMHLGGRTWSMSFRPLQVQPMLFQPMPYNSFKLLQFQPIAFRPLSVISNLLSSFEYQVTLYKKNQFCHIKRICALYCKALEI